MSKVTKYAYQWGESVVEAFLEKFARGTYFVCQMLDISREELAFRLIGQVCSEKQLKWEATKRVIKAADRETFRDYRSIPVRERKKYLQICLWNAQDDVIDEASTKVLEKQVLLDLD